MLNGIILLKRPYISLIIPNVPNVKTTYTKSGPETIFQLLTFPLTSFSMSSGVILLQSPYISFSSPLLLILRWEITAAAVAAVYRPKNLGSIIREI